MTSESIENLEAPLFECKSGHLTQGYGSFVGVPQSALKVLLTKYGSQLKNSLPEHSNQSMYECAHDWASQGNVNTNGIIKFYESYYS